jgi:translation initiation factor 2B subunit (eIF-2B alpha/beta/delta family)
MDTQENKKRRLMRTTSLNSIINYDNLKIASLQLKPKISFQPEENEFDEFDEIKEHRDNILSNIDDLISELESISDYIKDLAYEHINDNDTILTANHSDQLEEFFIEAAKVKTFHVIIAESAPSLK